MISLQLNIAGKKIIKVNVNESMPIKVLEQYYPDIASAFVLHNNSVVFPSFSFSFLGIKDNDMVYIVEDTTRKNEIKPASRISPKKNADFLKQVARKQNMGSLVPANLVLEVNRIKDLHLTRLENDPSSFRKIAKSFSYSSDLQQSASKVEMELNQPIIAPAGPSNTVLKVEWN